MGADEEMVSPKHNPAPSTPETNRSYENLQEARKRAKRAEAVFNLNVFKKFARQDPEFEDPEAASKSPIKEVEGEESEKKDNPSRASRKLSRSVIMKIGNYDREWEETRGSKSAESFSIRDDYSSNHDSDSDFEITAGDARLEERLVNEIIKYHGPEWNVDRRAGINLKEIIMIQADKIDRKNAEIDELKGIIERLQDQIEEAGLELREPRIRKPERVPTGTGRGSTRFSLNRSTSDLMEGRRTQGTTRTSNLFLFPIIPRKLVPVRTNPYSLQAIRVYMHNMLIGFVQAWLHMFLFLYYLAREARQAIWLGLYRVGFFHHPRSVSPRRPRLPRMPGRSLTLVLETVFVFVTLDVYFASKRLRDLWMRANGLTRMYLMDTAARRPQAYFLPGLDHRFGLGVRNTVVGVFSGTAQAIRKGVVEGASLSVEGKWYILKSIWAGIFWIIGAAKAAGNGFGSLCMSAWEAVKTCWDSFVDWLSAVWVFMRAYWAKGA